MGLEASEQSAGRLQRECSRTVPLSRDLRRLVAVWPVQVCVHYPPVEQLGSGSCQERRRTLSAAQRTCACRICLSAARSTCCLGRLRPRKCLLGSAPAWSACNRLAVLQLYVWSSAATAGSAQAHMTLPSMRFLQPPALMAPHSVCSPSESAIVGQLRPSKRRVCRGAHRLVIAVLQRLCNGLELGQRHPS